MISNKTVTDRYTTLIAAGPGVRLANVGMYFCNKSNQPNVLSLFAVPGGAGPSNSNIIAYNVSISPGETFYFGQEKFILGEGESLVAKAGFGEITATCTFMSIGSTDYSSNAGGVAVLDGDSVGGVVVTNGGSGYTEAPTVTFTGCDGADAEGTAVINSTGQVFEITITNGGSGYVCPPEVVLTGGNAPVVEGCTDPSADNYNHLATQDDGSCSYASHKVTKQDDITVWWKFDESSGTTATDTKGGLVATMPNPAGDDSEWVTGKPNMGNAVDFDGAGASTDPATGTYFSVPANPLLGFGANPFSISLWFKGDADMFSGTYQNTRTLLGTQKYYNSSGPNGNWILGIKEYPSNDHRVVFASYNGGNPPQQILAQTYFNGSWGELNDGNWHHLALTRSSAGTISAFIDGILSGTTATSVTENIDDGADNGIFIGGNIIWSNSKWKGLIDDIRIYNIELDSTDVSAIAAGDYV